MFEAIFISKSNEVVAILIFANANNLLFGCVDANDITTVESLQFDFRTIEAATNKFSTNNKLGEGGFGEVYKV